MVAGFAEIDESPAMPGSEAIAVVPPADGFVAVVAAPQDGAAPAMATAPPEAAPGTARTSLAGLHSGGLAGGDADFDAAVAMAEEFEAEACRQAATEAAAPEAFPEASPGSVPGAAAQPAPDDRLEFTTLRIAKRAIDAERWVAAIKGCRPPRRILPFTRLSELTVRQRQECDRVIVGVLYDRAAEDRFANGEHYLRWYLTDLGKPKPRCIALHLRFRAFQKWRGGQAAAEARRGAIFAVVNPWLVETERESSSGIAVARVDKDTQLQKLGECPSLGTCEMKGCRKPCNMDEGDRICNYHLSCAFADKPGRLLAGGGISAGLLTLLQARRGELIKKGAFRVNAPLDMEGDTAEERVERVKKARTNAALELDDRRFSHGKAKEDYVRSVLGVQRNGGEAPTSRVPMLGRGIDEEDGLDFDLSTIESKERKKAERILEHRQAERLDRAGEGPKRRVGRLSDEAPQSASIVLAPLEKRQRTEAAQAKPPALSELMQKLEGRRMARRAGARGSEPMARPRAEDAATRQKRPQPVSSRPAESLELEAPSGDVPEMMRDLRGACVDDVSDVDAARAGAALRRAERLPPPALGTMEGRQLDEMIARLATSAGRSDLQRLAKSIRRRWCLKGVAEAAEAAEAKSAAERDGAAGAAADPVATSTAPPAATVATPDAAPACAAACAAPAVACVEVGQALLPDAQGAALARAGPIGDGDSEDEP